MNAVAGHEFNKEKKQCQCGWKNDPTSSMHWEVQWARHLNSVRPNPIRDRLQHMENLAYGLTEIPANEQCIGHLQVAIQDFMHNTIAELKRLEEEK